MKFDVFQVIILCVCIGQIYSYGIDTTTTQTSFHDAHNFPDLSASVCPELFQNYSDAVDKLKSMNGIKTKVLQDLNAIHDKFPCNQFIHALLFGFVDKNVKFRNDACMLATQTEDMEVTSQNLTKYFANLFVESLEPILSTQLPDETFRSLLNFAKATVPGTPIEEIRKALEYVYDNVPEAECH